MQAHKQLQPFLNYSEILNKRKKMYSPKLKVITISKNIALTEGKS